MRSDGRPIVIWGAGSAGQIAARDIAGVTAFVDGDPAKWQTHVNGLPVWAPADLTRDARRPFVVVCSMYHQEIGSRLIDMGFVRDVDFTAIGSATTPAAREHAAEGVFAKIYEENGWRGDVSRSGMGSSLDATFAIRERFPSLVRELGVDVLLDAPCGDFAWMQALRDAVPRYIGADVVPALVERNQASWGSPRVSFVHRDLVTDALPQADLILCRDCLVHLTLRQALAVLANFQRSGARYLLATTFPSWDHNQDVPTGAWRPLNLTRPPFSCPPPLELLNERCVEGEGAFADKSLGLWDLRTLRLPPVDAHAS
jgi:hypothetical protein